MQHLQVARQIADRGGLEAQRQAFHPEIRRDQHLGEMRIGFDSGDRDHALAQRPLQATDRRLAHRDVLAAHQAVEAGQPFLRRIDGTRDPRPGHGRGGRAQGNHQVIQLKDGLSARLSHDLARIVDQPTFGFTGQDDVLGFGIRKHVADALQAGQESHVQRQRLVLARHSTIAASNRRNETFRSELARAISPPAGTIAANHARRNWPVVSRELWSTTPPGSIATPPTRHSGRRPESRR